MKYKISSLVLLAVAVLPACFTWSKRSPETGARQDHEVATSSSSKDTHPVVSSVSNNSVAPTIIDATVCSYVLGDKKSQTVSLNQLLKEPNKWDKKSVSFIAYLNFGFEKRWLSSFLIHEDSSSYIPFKQIITYKHSREMKETLKACNEKHVKIKGTFFVLRNSDSELDSMLYKSYVEIDEIEEVK